jgi:hypothetical protein
MNGDKSHSDGESNAPKQKKAENRAHSGGVRPLDLAIITLVVALTVIAGIRIYGNRGDESRLVIEAPTGRWIYALDRDLTVPIPGPLGDTVVEVKDGKARVKSSPCPNQTCVAARAIGKPGEWNACLPNEVMIRVENAGGEKDGGIDAFAE